MAEQEKTFSVASKWNRFAYDHFFNSIDELKNETKQLKENSSEVFKDMEELRFCPGPDDNIRLTDEKESFAYDLNNWSFDQLCGQLHIDRRLAQRLSRNVCVNVLNDLCKKFSYNHGHKVTKILMDHNSEVIRAFNGANYSRIWNYDVVDKLEELVDLDSWNFNPTGSSTKTGLCASDKDMFLFFVDNKNKIDDGSNDGLSRGTIIYNSEVGGGSWGGISFFFRWCCANNLIGGAKNITEVRLIHRGTVDNKFEAKLRMFLLKHKQCDAEIVQEQIRKLRINLLGKDKESTIDRLERYQVSSSRTISNNIIKLALEESERDDLKEKFSPYSYWGIIQGLTRYSQQFDSRNALRYEIDSSAGKLWSIGLAI